MVNSVFDTLSRVLTSRRRHSYAIGGNNDVADTKNSGNRGKRTVGANILSTSSSYILLDPHVENDGNCWGDLIDRNQSIDLLSVPNAMSIYPTNHTLPPSNGEKRSDKEGKSIRSNCDARIKSNSGSNVRGRRNRKQSLASTLFNMITVSRFFSPI